MEADGKTLPGALLDLMEDFAIQGDEVSAKECLWEYLKIMEGEADNVRNPGTETAAAV